SKGLYLASGFAAQKRNGQFLEVSKADRKALFADMLGFEHLQALSEEAGKQAKALEGELAKHDAKREALEAKKGQVEQLTAKLAEANNTLADATEARAALEEEQKKAHERYRV
ncbi:MAG: hypothetical protein GWN84_04985, partial [Gammaproteobacteria bacterium]|nr:hypothetical protein [Gammaproteobacteria bacterium]NIR82328.1 hypothetical protein [Gammaproteobacteria bacterium]NIU03469.1 hypothetical protein [Gammaproteobacteria bacterium]NIV50896.1 hypothetical protein [Gammaproteobacteria bacterium]NIX84744.1 hypothetical protein [Gammaproteobacteria bacterium]